MMVMMVVAAVVVMSSSSVGRASRWSVSRALHRGGRRKHEDSRGFTAEDEFGWRTDFLGQTLSGGQVGRWRPRKKK